MAADVGGLLLVTGLVAVAALSRPASGAPAAPAATAEDLAWLDAQREAALEGLMPLAGDRTTCAAYRSHRDGHPETAERYVQLCGEPGSLQALLISPQGGSIQQQLLTLHAGDRAARLDDLVVRVRILRTSLSPEDCPAWKARLDRLPKLEVALREPRAAAGSDATVHRLTVRGDGADLSLTTHQDDHPWARWGQDAVAALEQCAGIGR